MKHEHWEHVDRSEYSVHNFHKRKTHSIFHSFNSNSNIRTMAVYNNNNLKQILFILFMMSNVNRQPAQHINKDSFCDMCITQIRRHAIERKKQNPKQECKENKRKGFKSKINDFNDDFHILQNIVGQIWLLQSIAIDVFCVCGCCSILSHFRIYVAWFSAFFLLRTLIFIITIHQHLSAFMSDLCPIIITNAENEYI